MQNNMYTSKHDDFTKEPPPYSGFKDLILGCIQCNSYKDQTHNLQLLAPMIRTASEQGAELISLPEAANAMRQEKALTHFYTQDTDPFVIGIAHLAAELGCWIHLGSALLREGNKLVNRTLLFNSKGEIVASYDKIHLFKIRYGRLDIDESRQYQAGNTESCVTTPWGRIGFSICYDLRYPLMYRQLCAKGALMLAIPAAFTKVTGKAHWRSLLRARAIENACFVFAAAQGGKHEDGRSTYGHSLIIDPWGKVLAEKTDNKPGIICAKLSTPILAKARESLHAWADELPSLI